MIDRAQNEKPVVMKTYDAAEFAILTQKVKSTTSPQDPEGLKEVYRQTKVGDFPINASYVDQDYLKKMQELHYDNVLDDVALYKDGKGNFYCRVIYNQDGIYGTSAEAGSAKEGKLIAISEEKPASQGAIERSITLKDMRLTAQVVGGLTFRHITDANPDELKVRFIKENGSQKFDKLSIYGNVDKKEGEYSDYEYLLRLKSVSGGLTTPTGGALDLNGDGNVNEKVDDGDKPNQVSIILHSRSAYVKTL